MHRNQLVLVAFLPLISLAASVSAQVGTVWKKADVPAAQWQAIASSADGTTLCAASYEGLVYVSHNAGATWTSNSLPVGVNIRGNTVACSTNGFILAVATRGSSIYISTDSGATWTPHASTQNWAGVTCSADGTKMAACVENGQIYVSTDMGVTWTPRTTSDVWCGIACSSDGSKLVSAIGSFAGLGYIYTSSDSGTNWVQRGDYANSYNGVACSADGSMMAAVCEYDVTEPEGFNGNMFSSTDSGADWTSYGSWPAPSMNYLGVAISGDGRTWAGAADYTGIGSPAAGIYVSTNSGAYGTWFPAFAPGYNWSGITSSFDGSKMAATYYNGPGNGGIYTYAAPGTNAPTLNMAMQAGTAYLTWEWPSTGFVLQQNSDLATTNWTTVPVVPTVVNQVITTATNGSNFYRLNKP